jgi:hydroxymethylglutaryl-CoA lyase
MTAGRFVTIVEVAPRDGLQNEARLIATEDKVRLVNALSDCGFRRIEVTSFVDPRRVPQMGDAATLMAAIRRRPGVRYGVLTPNLKGYTAARAASADEVAVFASASETFSQRNINCSIAESLDRFRPVAEAARGDGVPLRGYVSCVTDCPYEGPVAPERVAEVAAGLFALGCHEVSLGDTIGHGTPSSVDRMLDAVLAVSEPDRLAGHFHDTLGRALENIDVCLDRGLRVFDASAGGLGGCPFAPGAAGNVATEAVVDHLEAIGFETGIDRPRLAEAARFARDLRSAP